MYVFYDCPLPHKCTLQRTQPISLLVLGSVFSDCVVFYGDNNNSGDWLLALPVTSCGLRLTDEAVRVAVALRLGCSVCVAHTCRCGALVDAQGIHGSVCKQPLVE